MAEYGGESRIICLEIVNFSADYSQLYTESDYVRRRKPAVMSRAGDFKAIVMTTRHSASLTLRNYKDNETTPTSTLNNTLCRKMINTIEL